MWRPLLAALGGSRLPARPYQSPISGARQANRGIPCHSLLRYRVGVGDPAVDPAQPLVDLHRGSPEVDPRLLDGDPPDVGGVPGTGQASGAGRRPRATPATEWPSAGPRRGSPGPRCRTGSRAGDPAPGGSPRRQRERKQSVGRVGSFVFESVLITKEVARFWNRYFTFSKLAPLKSAPASCASHRRAP